MRPTLVFRVSEMGETSVYSNLSESSVYSSTDLRDSRNLVEPGEIVKYHLVFDDVHNKW